MQCSRRRTRTRRGAGGARGRGRRRRVRAPDAPARRAAPQLAVRPLDVRHSGRGARGAAARGRGGRRRGRHRSAPYVQPTAGAPRHTTTRLTGGAIGWGLPAATGAAVACPGRPVICWRRDGCGHVHDPGAVDAGARAPRRDDVIIANRSYAILEFEFSRVGAEGDGPRAGRELLTSLGRPGSTSSRSRVHGRAGPPRRRRAGELAPRCARRSPSPART